MRHHVPVVLCFDAGDDDDDVLSNSYFQVIYSCAVDISVWSTLVFRLATLIFMDNIWWSTSKTSLKTEHGFCLTYADTFAENFCFWLYQ